MIAEAAPDGKAPGELMTPSAAKTATNAAPPAPAFIRPSTLLVILLSRSSSMPHQWDWKWFPLWIPYAAPLPVTYTSLDGVDASSPDLIRLLTFRVDAMT